MYAAIVLDGNAEMRGGKLTWKSKGFAGRRKRPAQFSTPFSLSAVLYSTCTAPDLLSPAPQPCSTFDNWQHDCEAGSLHAKP